MAHSSPQPDFAGDSTQKGRLPPLEVMKAYAFEKVLERMEKQMRQKACTLLGEDKGSFIAKNLTLKGGGHPTDQCVYQTIRRCKTKGWYPGKGMGKSTGRTPDISQHQKEEVARVLMEGKRKLIKPTPAHARGKLPRLSINPASGAPISNWTIYNIMHTMCYDEDEDDPWVYMHSPSKDYLSDGMKKARDNCGNHYLERFATGAWATHVAVDPCITILAANQAQSDDQKVAALGIKKMMSPNPDTKAPTAGRPRPSSRRRRTTSKYIGRPSSLSARSTFTFAMPTLLRAPRSALDAEPWIGARQIHQERLARYPQSR